MSSSQEQNRRGIDIHQALEILAARGEHHTHNTTSSSQHKHHDCCDCQNSPFSAQALQNNATMGQVIDILGNNSEKDKSAANTNSNDAASSSSAMDQQSQKEEMEKRRQERQAEMQEQLQKMTLQELLQTVLQTQEERVATYRRYDQGLQSVLQSNGNMTLYPAVVAEATASFAVLSDTIRNIRQVLLHDTAATSNATSSQDSEKKEMAQLLSRLQLAEQNKLHLTAALHLEKIRISAADTSSRESPSSSTGMGAGEEQPKDAAPTANTNSKAAAAAEDKINRLYRESIASLQIKIATCVDEINEVLEEIRCTMME